MKTEDFGFLLSFFFFRKTFFFYKFEWLNLGCSLSMNVYVITDLLYQKLVYLPIEEEANECYGDHQLTEKYAVNLKHFSIKRLCNNLC